METFERVKRRNGKDFQWGGGGGGGVDSKYEFKLSKYEFKLSKYEFKL